MQGDTTQEWGRTEEGMLARRGKQHVQLPGGLLSQHGAFPLPSDRTPHCFCSAQITDPLLGFPTKKCGAYLQNLRTDMPAGMCSTSRTYLFPFFFFPMSRLPAVAGALRKLLKGSYTGVL